MLAAILARAPMAARVEGVLDHDQSIVGLMALDIAALRRWPIFFDGQRYMGALEAYVAGLFVALFGHSPVTVALSPLLFFGVFVAGQYAVWRLWADRKTGHWAALITILSAPMLALWSVVPRGGYIELLAWALPVLAIYRAVTRPGADPLSKPRQAAWGFLLAFGYFLNPLSLIVYSTLAVDWTFGRHGVDLKRSGRVPRSAVEGRWATLFWGLIGLGLVVGLALCCHVEFRAKGLSPFVFCTEWVPAKIALPLGVAGIAVLLGGSMWWSGLAGRLIQVLPKSPWFMIGTLGALFPFAMYNLCVRAGVIPPAQSLPIWIRAPWFIGVNIRDGFQALGPLVGCSPHGPASVLIGQGVELPAAVWPNTVRLLEWLTPVTVALVIVLLGLRAWNDRREWRRFWSLQGEDASPGTVLALLGLIVSTGLYLLQATSPNASSIRYLVPIWIFLPGVLASAFCGLPKVALRFAAPFLLGAWCLAQVNLWAEMNRPSPLRPLAEILEKRGVRGMVAETPLALMVTNLSHGHVGALEFRSTWPRLWDRYISRFPEGQPVTCVVDTELGWYAGEDPTGARNTTIGEELRKVAKRFPGKARIAWRFQHYEIWEVDLPLSEFNSVEVENTPLPSAPGSANLASVSNTVP